MEENANTEPRKKKKRKVVPAKVSYVNVNRGTKGYRDKYRRDVENAVMEFAQAIGKQDDGSDFTDDEWKRFFKTNLIPLDKESEIHMIDLFKDNRPELNELLVLHNTKAGYNIAEVYFKRYVKTTSTSTQWYDLEDFKQMANEGLVIAAERFDPKQGNKFITFATWWILNRVRKPYQEKGAMENRVSLNAPMAVDEADNPTTLGEVLSQDKVSPDWISPSSGEGNENAIDHISRKSYVANRDLYGIIRDFKENSIDSIDKNKVKQMMGYLLSILKQNENSYDNRQIFLYLFKKVFNKYSTMFPDIPKDSIDKLNNYVSEAAKSKSELLKRLNMNEKEYTTACKKLTRRCYNGI